MPHASVVPCLMQAGHSFVIMEGSAMIKIEPGTCGAMTHRRATYRDKGTLYDTQANRGWPARLQAKGVGSPGGVAP